MIRLLLALLHKSEVHHHQRERRRAAACIRGDLCWAEPGVVHYHHGYGQRHTSLIPVTGPNSFSDGRPYVKPPR